MNVFPAKPFDIDSIMAIERQAFIPQIQEKKKCFEKRLEIFPEGFLILSDASETVVKTHGNALTVGYFCCELWDSFPSGSDTDEVFKRKFALGHNPKDTHSKNGMYLYVSSFALRKEYQGKGLGRQFFENSLTALCGANSTIKKVVVLVNEDWSAARSIYKSLGFEEIRTLPDFFPTIKKIGLFKRKMAAGIVMSADAESFRKKDFDTDDANPDEKNIWRGIRI